MKEHLVVGAGQEKLRTFDQQRDSKAYTRYWGLSLREFYCPRLQLEEHSYRSIVSICSIG